MDRKDIIIEIIGTIICIIIAAVIVEALLHLLGVKIYHSAIIVGVSLGVLLNRTKK